MDRIKKILQNIWERIKAGAKRLRLYFKAKVNQYKVPGAPKPFRRTKRSKTKKPKVASSFKIISDSFKFLKREWKIFAVILACYIVAYFVLAYATPNIDLGSVFKKTSDATTEPGIGQKLKTLSSALFTYRGSATDFARWAQFVLALLFSLMFIYALRQRHKGINIRARDAIYSGSVNLIPFLIGVAVIAIELIPLAIISMIYGIANGRGFLINDLERFVGMGIILGAALITFYFIPAAIISLYARTVPGVYPTKAMAATRIMVSLRRWEVLKHLFVFIVFTVCSYLILLLLLVTYLPRFANLSLDLFFLVALPIIHTMMYKLYLRLLEG
jgi:hypothetical protein